MRTLVHHSRSWVGSVAGCFEPSRSQPRRRSPIRQRPSSSCSSRCGSNSALPIQARTVIASISRLRCSIGPLSATPRSLSYGSPMTKAAAHHPKPTQSSQAPQPATPTLGQQLHHAPGVRAAIGVLINELKAKSAQITDIRPPRPELKQSYDDLIARATAARGRGLLYPYMGSGIGNGALVELADGSIKWDMICGIGVHFFGHSDPDLAEAAIISGLDDTLKHGNLSSGFEPYEFMETLLREAGRASKLKHCYLSTSGAMA